LDNDWVWWRWRRGHCRLKLIQERLPLLVGDSVSNSVSPQRRLLRFVSQSGHIAIATPLFRACQVFPLLL
jgi:hypothetical protein